MPAVVAPAHSTSTKPPRPVAVYVRVSTAEQTVEGQEAELVAYCEGRGWAPVIFRDVQSGAAASRPGLEKLLAPPKKGSAPNPCGRPPKRTPPSTAAGC